MPFICIQKIPLSFSMRRSGRAKRLQVLVREQQFEIVAPLKVKNSEILTFVKQVQRWMLKQTQKNKVNKERRYWPQNFLAGEILYFRNKEFFLNVEFGKKAQMSWQNTILTLTVPCHQLKTDYLAQYIKEQVIKWYKQQALAALEVTLTQFCPLIGRWPAGYCVKKQKTRWGSCGTKQKIHINWLLMLAPFGVLEYVVVHELCHLFHPNHGKRFWAKVETLLPDYKKYKHWLTKNGHLLTLG